MYSSINFQKRLIVLATMIFSWAAWGGAVQLSDGFDNAAYDGSYDSTLWDAGSSSPTLVQGASQMVINLPDANWAGSFMATKTPITIQSDAIRNGTKFSATLNSFTVTTDSDQARGGISVDQSLQMMFYDSVGQNGGQFGYAGESLAFLFYQTNAESKVAIEVFEKDPGNGGNIGNTVAIRTVDVTFPLQIDVILNQYYYELQFNGTKVLGGVTNLDPANFNGVCGFELIGANTNNSRGTLTLDSIEISDAAVAAFTQIPDIIEDNFSLGAQAEKFYQVEGVGGSIVYSTTGTVVLTTPDGDWAEIGIQWLDSFPQVEGEMFPLKADIISIDPTAGELNSILCVTERPDIANAYYAQGSAAVKAFITAGADGAGARLSVLSKPRGTAYNNGAWPPPLDSQATTLTLPATVELKVDASNYEVWINGVKEAEGTHDANFTGSYSGYVGQGNQGAGRGSIEVDNFSAGALVYVPVELSTFMVE